MGEDAVVDIEPSEHLNREGDGAQFLTDNTSMVAIEEISKQGCDEQLFSRPQKNSRRT